LAQSAVQRFPTGCRVGRKTPVDGRPAAYPGGPLCSLWLRPRLRPTARFRNGLRHTGSDLLRRAGIALGAVIDGGILATIHRSSPRKPRPDPPRARRHCAPAATESASLVAVLGTDLAVEHRVAKAV